MGICPEGTYSSEENKLCLPCHSQCRSCRNASETSCISCKSDLFLIHDAMTCVEFCPEQYYTGKNFDNLKINDYVLKIKIDIFENVFVVKVIVHHVIQVLIYVHHVLMVMHLKILIVSKHQKNVNQMDILILLKMSKKQKNFN